MGEIINLNRARKARDRAAEKAQARENRMKFGRDKASKAQDSKQAEDAARRLDGARLDEE